ncbi:MAG: hypothetical protein UT53_C0012G0010 [Candidatus Yanofskybacteria bacterium GW2011_GWD2_39_48]|uniref:Glycosidase related protein n=1 Tax=Candidatus Yanofskybacteria bacterium GW2011_GWD2_39_48 TaxID=1619031 RepID=A0A0G0RMA8_9BACT|nr:MAG: hypothetical protein UT53_C0012G0010 [Candidatus Yanofskybacteria bacterium GW2011_GWD2_39_48]
MRLWRGFRRPTGPRTRKISVEIIPCSRKVLFSIATREMSDSYEKLSKLLRTPPQVLIDLDSKMSSLTGKMGVMDNIVKENELLVNRTLDEFGLHKDSSASDVYATLMQRLMHLDQHLFELIGKPDLTKPDEADDKLTEAAFNVFTPPKGFFIKKEKVAELLEKFKPDKLLGYFGYNSVAQILAEKDFASVVSSLRFTQSNEWMHNFFDIAYNELTPNDFEEREVDIKILGGEWLKVAENFLEKKYHNISHLKEFGIIFVIPLPIDTAGEATRMFTLILHYLHEVPFYSNLFRKFSAGPDFIKDFKSLLRGDIPTGPTPDNGKINWRIVQRYLAKDNELDFRLFEPHINPEAEHWFNVGKDLGKMGGEGGSMNMGYWHGLDFVGGYFPDGSSEKLVSFDLIDLIMSLVKKGEVKYLYHQQEALWNKIFVDYMGRDKLSQAIEENIIKGFVEL